MAGWEAGKRRWWPCCYLLARAQVLLANRKMTVAAALATRGHTSGTAGDGDGRPRSKAALGGDGGAFGAAGVLWWRAARAGAKVTPGGSVGGYTDGIHGGVVVHTGGGVRREARSAAAPGPLVAMVCGGGVR